MSKRILTILFFAITIAEITVEYFRVVPAIFVLKPLVSVILMLLYWQTSKENNILYYAVISSIMITNLFFIPKGSDFIFYALLVFTVHRFFLLYYFFKIIKIKDYYPLIIATIPFLFLFFYIFVGVDILTDRIYYLMILHNTIISVLGGLALSNYVMNDNNKSSWLMICVILFVSIHFIVFVEKFYFEIKILRPIAMLMNALGYYTFYRFILETEQSHSNESIKDNFKH